MLLKEKLPEYQALEDHLVKDEKSLIDAFLNKLKDLAAERPEITTQAKTWIEALRSHPLSTFDVQRFLQAFPLTHEEGRALMAIAEAYLRIPDVYTANLLLKDKVSNRNWRQEGSKENSLIRFSRWGLDFFKLLQSRSWGSFSQPVSRRVFKIFMGLISREFILGQTIEEALKRRQKMPSDRISFDMLGEGARTFSMAQAYKEAYAHAIQAIGSEKAKGLTPFERDSISVKLSALHPHYNFAHREEVMKTLLPDLMDLCALARDAGITLTIDAEEAARLELSLDLIHEVCSSKSLKDWDGFGFVIQAYQKRAIAVVEWTKELSKKTKKHLMIRLVKGAYWDTEIKLAQVGGFPTYPVFTRKAATDLSYLACAQELLKAEGHLYPQFATHNAYTVAAILQMVKGREDIEFQRLQGMGEKLYKVIKETYPIACRVYAPVGKDRDLLPYLVRRLLENGANSSFVHKIYDKALSVEETLGDPWEFFKTHPSGSHPKIPSPKDLYGKTRKNSQGYDLSNRKVLCHLKKDIEGSLKSFGEVKEIGKKELEEALKSASSHWQAWDLKPAEERAQILNRAADLIEERRGLFLGLLIKEGKKTLADAISELREAADFCRYYAAESLKHFSRPDTLKGPTGEQNELVLRGRGVFACISPWNFPLAIFMGQVAAALASGNAVIAKPASQTPLVGFHALQALYDAGVPRGILHFLPGKSRIIGDPLVDDQRISGVVFTGSTSTAQHIQRILSERGGPLVPLIAETGGINAMIVDSSALIEQVVDDVIASAFQRAGQRCSALRVLFVQDEIYDETVAMLKEAMESLKVGDPQWLSTDVGLVIDEAAWDEIEAYVAGHSPLARTSLSKGLEGTFVAPTLIEVQGMEDVKKEVFGPVLHVARFKAQDLEGLVKSINESGYGLTLGLQTRIEETIRKVRELAHIGNLYVNRNMIGAVVGVQPFGGEGLSGTGPKAGGPYYLPRFAAERTFSYNITASGGNVSLLNLEE